MNRPPTVWWSRWGPWVWMAAGAFLRGFRLGNPSLWLDEVFSYDMTTHPVGGPADLAPLAGPAHLPQVSILARLFNVDGHPPLYYLVLKGWLWLTWRGQAGPPPEWLLRVPSWAFTVGALWLTYCLAKRLLGPGPAQWVLAVLALSQAPVWLTQEVRMYPLLSLLVVGAVLGVVRWWQDGSWWGLGWWVACSVLGWYTQYLAALSPVAVWVWAVWTQRGRRWWGFAGGSAAILAAAWWWLPVVMHQMQAHHGPPNLSAMATIWWAQIPNTLKGLMLGQSLPEWGTPAGGVVVWWVLVALVGAVCVTGTVGLGRLGRTGAAVLAVTQLFVPMAILLAVPLASSHYTSMYQVRFFMYLTPFAALILGGALSLLWAGASTRMAAAVLAVILLGCNAVSLLDWYFVPMFQRQQWKDVIATVAPLVKPGDGIWVQYSYNALVVEYYLERDGIAWIPVYTPRPEAIRDGTIGEYLDHHPRIWLMTCSAWKEDPGKQIPQWLEARYVTAGVPVVFQAQIQDSLTTVGLFVMRRPMP